MRSIYVWRNGELVDRRYVEPAPTRQSTTVMPDIAGFQTPIDGSWISSRSQLREHERRYGVRQCGELKSAADYSAQKPYRAVLDD